MRGRSLSGGRQPRVVPGVARSSGRRQGLSAERVEAEVRRQGGLCALCLRPLGVHFAVDHDHLLAERHGHAPERGCERCFRAVVCHRCNAVLGWGRDDPAYFRRLADYVELARAGALR